jgi:CubicO group peptidase (beta-lactamase class C family)
VQLPQDILGAVEDRDLERFGVTALAIAVNSGGDGYQEAWGVPVETTFRIASITKPIVAAAAMRLVEQGKLALDDPLTGFRLPWEGITLRHLLSHQAALAYDWSKPLSSYGEGDDALQRMADDEAVGAPVGPGRFFSYSNPGYWLTGALIQRATGKPFEDALQELTLEPLGMERTGFTPIEPSVPSDLPFPRARRASGGLYSCVEDLRCFTWLLQGEAFPSKPFGHAFFPLSRASVEEMRTPQVAVGPDGDYGLGLGVVRGRGCPTIEHGGAVAGIRAQLLIAEGSSYVLLTNSERGHFLIDRLLGAVGLALHLPPEVEVSEDDLAAVAGTFREPLGMTIRVTPREGGIELTLVGQERSAHLRPTSPTRFVVREGEEKGDWAEFFEDGRLMRYETLFERVPA